MFYFKAPDGAREFQVDGAAAERVFDTDGARGLWRGLRALLDATASKIHQLHRKL